MNDFQLKGICRHAESSYPQEACGVITDRAIVPCGNSARDRNVHFEITSAELERISRAGNTIEGFYHSHPDSGAIYSPSDLAGAHTLGLLYAIVSVIRGKARELRIYRLEGTCEEDKRLVRVELDGIWRPE